MRVKLGSLAVARRSPFVRLKRYDEVISISRNPTRTVKIGSIMIGSGHPIAVQSMTATKTTDVVATVDLVNLMAAAGADVVRIAVDSQKDAEALAEIRRQTTANLSVDLQENYRMAFDLNIFR